MTAFGQETTQAAAQQPNLFMSFLPMIIIFMIFYFLVIRPQKRSEIKRQEALSKLQPGSIVVTNSGIFGKIVAMRDKDVDLEISKNVTIKILRSNIASSAEPQEAKS